jgi:hypothetical protein
LSPDEPTGRGRLEAAEAVCRHIRANHVPTCPIPTHECETCRLVAEWQATAARTKEYVGRALPGPNFRLTGSLAKARARDRMRIEVLKRSSV